MTVSCSKIIILFCDSLQFLNLISCVYYVLLACMSCNICVPNNHRVHRKALDPLLLGLHTAVGCHVLGIEPGLSGRRVSAHNHQTIHLSISEFHYSCASPTSPQVALNPWISLSSIKNRHPTRVNTFNQNQILIQAHVRQADIV